MRKKQFAAIILNPKYETFIIYVVFFSCILFDASVHLSYKLQIAGLIAKKAFTKVFAKYTDFADVFSLDLVFKLFEHTRINNHAIGLVDSQ